jgi:hypothetical protein
VKNQTDHIAVICMIATIAVSVFYSERNYRLARENQKLAREQYTWVKNCS